MRTLVDANFLLRIAQPQSTQHSIAISASIELSNAGIELCLVPQTLYEYWVVATRPVAVNGLGLSVPEVESLVNELLNDLTLLRDERGIFTHWYELVVKYSVHGKIAHDTRLVAAMKRHGLNNLLTFNRPDFARFPGINVFTPEEVIAGQIPM